MQLEIKQIVIALLIITSAGFSGNYPIVDTGQFEVYDNSDAIDAPQAGEAFYGQDAQYNDIQLTPSYQDNGDGTVTDLVTGLMWVQERGEKLSWADAVAGAEEANTGGHDDWRMPTIKELYSLIDFRGSTQPTIEASTPFIDTDYFEFEYGNEDLGERIIDCQDWSATKYIGLTMGGDSTIFGVNFADGRIKGYPQFRREQNMADNRLYVRYVSGNANYGINDFIDNQDGTVSDRATGLMWQKGDSEAGMNWEEALAWVKEKNEEELLGYSDWRLPNAKELQSLLDYTEAPRVTGSPAIDGLFECSEIFDEGDGEEYPFYWTNTTHADGPGDQEFAKAVYICFGTGLGWMQPPGNNEYVLLDVHGAGAQRSDPKVGDPEDYPHGHGPQGDVIRVFNYVRLVRGESEAYSVNEDHGYLPSETKLLTNYPNPFNSSTRIRYQLGTVGQVNIAVFDINGRMLTQLYTGVQKSGEHSLDWFAGDLPTGEYLVRLSTPVYTSVQKVTLIR